MAEQVFFPCEKLTLEGLYEKRPGSLGAVITHPHPLYGGDMENPVVEVIALALADAGFSTLRFNFRGVGQSKGSFENGAGEAKDVAAAVRYLTGKLKRKKIWLAGYSFGAWVNALAAKKLKHPPMLMVAPPVAFLDFNDVSTLPGLQFAVAANRDEFAPATLVTNWVAAANPGAECSVIEGTDHFFWSHLEELKGILDESLKKCLKKK